MAAATDPKLYSLREVVTELSQPPEAKQRVLNLAKKHSLGQKVGWSWVFTASDVSRLRQHLT